MENLICEIILPSYDSSKEGGLLVIVCKVFRGSKQRLLKELCSILEK